MATTHFFPVNDENAIKSKFSAQGMVLWEKYFAPHIQQSGNDNVFQIRILDVEPEGSGGNHLIPPSAPKRKRKNKAPMLETEVAKDGLEVKLKKKGKHQDKNEGKINAGAKKAKKGKQHEENGDAEDAVSGRKQLNKNNK